MDATNGGRKTERGLGLALSVDENTIMSTAEAAEAAGYASFWVNNPPGGDALAVLGGVARRTTRVHLGVGVIPLSHNSPQEIAVGVREQEVPRERLYLGIGSGSGSHGVQRVEDAIRVLEPELHGSIVVAALGPRMCRLAGRTADGVLLNWLTPAYARESVRRIEESAHTAKLSTPRLMVYVRVALGKAAGDRLREEADRYSAISHYATHFERMGAAAVDTGIIGETAADIQRGLSAWDGIVDEVVMRAITANDEPEEIRELLEAATPR
ncbi:MAG: LLM class flavin-dependent oxidoreductase [Chloroflexota bacterium]